MSEMRLFDPGPVTHGLTDRQQRALDAIREVGAAGLTTDELGAVLHHPKHPLHDRCAFCGSTGQEVGRALRAKGLARQTRRRAPGGDAYMVWVAVHQPTPERGPTSEIPY